MDNETISSTGSINELIVPGMGSDHCARIIRTTLQRLDGIAETTTNIANYRVNVSTCDCDLDADADALRRAMLFNLRVDSFGTAKLHKRLYELEKLFSVLAFCSFAICVNQPRF